MNLMILNFRMVEYELMDILVDTVKHLENLKGSNSASKEDVCDDIRQRLAIIIGKIVSFPVTTNFALPHCDVDISQSNNEDIIHFFEEEDSLTNND